MSHYQKLAVIIIRMIAVCVTLYGLIGMASAVPFVILLLRSPMLGLIGLLSPVTYFILGIVLFALSKPLAALIARGL